MRILVKVDEEFPRNSASIVIDIDYYEEVFVERLQNIQKGLYGTKRFAVAVKNMSNDNCIFFQIFRGKSLQDVIQNIEKVLE